MTASPRSPLTAIAIVLYLSTSGIFQLSSVARAQVQQITQENNNSRGAAAEESKPLTAPLDVAVPTTPWAFQGNGKWHLVYELHVANFGSAICTLAKIEVSARGPTQKKLAIFEGKDLSAMISHRNGDSPTATAIAGAEIVVVYMWVTLDRREDVPAALFHQITLKLDGDSGTLQISTPNVTVNRTPVPVIGPPLRGGDWGAAHGPGNGTHHRRGLLTINGHAYIAERFAIDWLRITTSGDIHTGNAGENRNYPGYGAEVLVVADGSIAGKREGIPDNSPGTTDGTAITLETLCGNYVILRFGSSLYATYCHLKPGSIRVKVGDKVTRGQVLGMVGNSGSSGAPHLHFQVCDGDSTFACEGVPYALRSFVQETRSFNSPDGKPHPDLTRTMEIPTFEMLVRFVDSPNAVRH